MNNDESISGRYVGPHGSAACLICKRHDVKMAFAAPPDKWSSVIGWHHGPIYWYCPTCTGLTQFPRMDEKSYKSFYEEQQRSSSVGYSDVGVPTTHVNRKSHDAAVKWKIFEKYGLTEHFPPDSVVFEIGPAEGALLASFRERGFSVSGIEPLARYAAFARDHYRVEVTTGFFDQHHQPLRAPNIVIIDNVLEHLSDPAVTLGTVRGFIEKSGLVLILVPNVEMPYVSNANISHYTLWSRHSLNFALAEAGFEVISVSPGRPTARPHEWIALARASTCSRAMAADAVPSFEHVQRSWGRAIRVFMWKRRARKALGPLASPVSLLLQRLRRFDPRVPDV